MFLRLARWTFLCSMVTLVVACDDFPAGGDPDVETASTTGGATNDEPRTA